MAKRLRDIGVVPEEDEPQSQKPKPKAGKKPTVVEDDEPPQKSRAPLTEIAAPEFESSRLHNGQLEFLTLVRVVMDPELQGRLWPRLTEEHFAADPTRALFQRLKTLHQAGRDWPKLAVLSKDPALPASTKLQLETVLARADRGKPLIHGTLKLSSDKEVALESNADFEGLVFDLLESYRITRKAAEHYVDAIAQIADAETFDPLLGPSIVEKAASDVLSIRGQESIADVLMHFGYQTTDTDKAKRKEEVRKMGATDRPRFKTGFAAYDEKAGGFQPGEVVLLGSTSGGGKCLTDEALTLTSCGLLSMGEIASHLPCGYTEAAFEVHGREGRESISHIYKEAVTKTFKVSTALGFNNQATAAHRVLTVREGVVDWSFQKDLTPGDAVVIMSGQRLWGSTIQLPTAVGVCTQPTMSLGLAKILGYLVSEGHFNTTGGTKLSFSNHDQEIMDDYVKTFKAVFPEEAAREDETTEDGRVVGLCHSVRPQFVAWWEEIGLLRGLSADREVPRCIRVAPEPFVVAFLQALFEGDGYIQQDDKKQVLYTTTSSELHRQVKLLLLNLGIVTNTVEQDKTATNGTPGNISHAYTLIIGHKYVDVFAERIGFLSSRKKAELVECLRRGQSQAVGRKTEYLHGANKALQSAWRAVRQKMIEVKTSFAALPGGEKASNCVRNAVYKGRPTNINCSTLLDFADHLGVTGPEVDTLRFLTSAEVVCDLITSIETIETEVTVYDFVVPGTHSFCANGLVQHNTAMELSLMLNMARMGTSVAMLQLELSLEQIDERLSSSLANINSDVLRSGGVTPKLQQRIDEAWDEFHEECVTAQSRCTFYAPSEQTVAGCEMVFKQFKYDVWFIDYVNLLTGDNDKLQGWERLSTITKQFKRLAKKYGICIVLAVQINVDKETGEVEVRYAKAMREDADVVIVWLKTKEAEAEGRVWLRHLKARQYEPFDFPVGIALHYCRFESLSTADVPKPKVRKLGKKKLHVKDELDVAIENAPPISTFRKKEKPLVVPDEKPILDAALAGDMNPRKLELPNDGYADLDES